MEPTNNMSLAELKKVAEAKLESIRGLVDEKEYLRLLDFTMAEIADDLGIDYKRKVPLSRRR